jgi:thiamine-phosphate pyrophosphorylase
MPYPDRFYPVIDSLPWLQRLAALGVGTVQLRAKSLDDAEALALVREALGIVAGTGTRLVVNDYWRAAIEAKAEHLHLGQEDLADADLGAIRRSGLTLGVSTHDDAELDSALRARPDYVALGPIFPTTLKSMRFAPQGIARITEWKRRIGAIPLVAIGGIKLAHAAEIYAAGADAIAVVSDVTGHADPDARVRDWLAASASIDAAPGRSTLRSFRGVPERAEIPHAGDPSNLIRVMPAKG